MFGLIIYVVGRVLDKATYSEKNKVENAKLACISMIVVLLIGIPIGIAGRLNTTQKEQTENITTPKWELMDEDSYIIEGRSYVRYTYKYTDEQGNEYLYFIDSDPSTGERIINVIER
jgi:hypothetical protein